MGILRDTLFQYYIDGCSCTPHIDYDGYGDCQKADEQGVGCYVNENATCSDAFRILHPPGIYSWEACQQIDGTLHFNCFLCQSLLLISVI